MYCAFADWSNITSCRRSDESVRICGLIQPSRAACTERSRSSILRARSWARAVARLVLEASVRRCASSRASAISKAKIAQMAISPRIISVKRPRRGAGPTFRGLETLTSERVMISATRGSSCDAVEQGNPTIALSDPRRYPEMQRSVAARRRGIGAGLRRHRVLHCALWRPEIDGIAVSGRP